MKNLENLKLSFPELETSVKQSTKGGWGGYSDGWGNYGGWGTPNNPFNLPEIRITPGGGSYDQGTPNGNTTPHGNPYWGGGWSDSGNPGYGDQGGGGGTSGGAGSTPRPNSSDPNQLNWRDTLGTAITAGLASNEAYTTLDMARLGNLPLDARSIAKNIFETTPVETFKNLYDDIKQIKGIAILDAAGKALGIWAAAESVGKVIDDIADGGDFNYMNLADATVNVGSLFIKSNVVGISVSLGWMVIKTAIESSEAQSISTTRPTRNTGDANNPPISTDPTTPNTSGGGRPSRAGNG